MRRQAMRIKAAAFLKVLREYDVKIKSLLSEVFGPENDFDRILGGVNLAAAATNGERVVTNLLAALTPIIEAGAKRGIEDKASSAVAKAAANRAQRRAAAKAAK